MKTQTFKLIFTFCILNSAFCIHLNAQIVYTDVNPDLTSNGAYNLDLNNDGITDFIIAHTSSTATHYPCGTRTSHYIKITPQASNAVISSGNYPVKLTGGTVINASSLTWNNIANQVVTGSFWNIFTCKQYKYLQWYSVVDGYLGLKFIANGNTYYGWARLSTSGASSFTIKDYAYDSTPNHSILAGVTSGARFAEKNSLEENNFSLISYPNPFFNSTTISFSLALSQNVSVKIFDITGKLVKTLADEKLPEGTNQLKWNAMDEKENAVNAGIYFLRFETVYYSESKKISVTK